MKKIYLLLLFLLTSTLVGFAEIKEWTITASDFNLKGEYKWYDVSNEDGITISTYGYKYTDNTLNKSYIQVKAGSCGFAVSKNTNNYIIKGISFIFQAASSKSNSVGVYYSNEELKLSTTEGQYQVPNNLIGTYQSKGEKVDVNVPEGDGYLEIDAPYFLIQQKTGNNALYYTSIKIWYEVPDLNHLELNYSNITTTKDETFDIKDYIAAYQKVTEDDKETEEEISGVKYTIEANEAFEIDGTKATAIKSGEYTLNVTAEAEGYESATISIPVKVIGKMMTLEYDDELEINEGETKELPLKVYADEAKTQELNNVTFKFTDEENAFVIDTTDGKVMITPRLVNDCYTLTFVASAPNYEDAEGKIIIGVNPLSEEEKETMTLELDDNEIWQMMEGQSLKLSDKITAKNSEDIVIYPAYSLEDDEDSANFKIEEGCITALTPGEFKPTIKATLAGYNSETVQVMVNVAEAPKPITHTLTKDSFSLTGNTYSTKSCEMRVGDYTITYTGHVSMQSEGIGLRTKKSDNNTHSGLWVSDIKKIDGQSVNPELFGYYISNIEVEWATTTTQRTLDFYYSKDYPMTSASDMFSDSNSGVSKLDSHSLNYDNKDTKDTSTDFSEEQLIKYLGMRSYDGMLALKSIKITWTKYEPELNIAWNVEGNIVNDNVASVKFNPNGNSLGLVVVDSKNEKVPGLSINDYTIDSQDDIIHDSETILYDNVGTYTLTHNLHEYSYIDGYKLKAPAPLTLTVGKGQIPFAEIKKLEIDHILTEYSEADRSHKYGEYMLYIDDAGTPFFPEEYEGFVVADVVPLFEPAWGEEQENNGDLTFHAKNHYWWYGEPQVEEILYSIVSFKASVAGKYQLTFKVADAYKEMLDGEQSIILNLSPKADENSIWLVTKYDANDKEGWTSEDLKYLLIPSSSQASNDKISLAANDLDHPALEKMQFFTNHLGKIWYKVTYRNSTESPNTDHDASYLPTLRRVTAEETGLDENDLPNDFSEYKPYKGEINLRNAEQLDVVMNVNGSPLVKSIAFNNDYHPENIPTEVEEIPTVCEGEAEYYSLEGFRTERPTMKGIYVRRANGTSSLVIVR